MVMNSSEAGAKWARRAQGASPDYSSGIARAADWQGATLRGNENYKAGVSQAAAEDRFAKGVQKVSSAAWKEAAQTKGTERWARGVSASQNKYIAAIGPVLGAISEAESSAPARGPRGSGQNYQRSQHFGERLHKLRTGGV